MTDINIRSALIGGTFWTAVGRYSQHAVRLGVTAVLARLLDPSDFGVLAMVVVYTGFVTLLAEAGIGATVIQKRELDDKALSTVFWFVALLSLAFAVFTIIIAPFIETFFDFPGLALVVQVMSITLLLAGMGAVPDGRLRRALRFKQVAAIEIVSSLFSGAVAIFLALEGVGYWALVFQVISGMSIRLVCLLAFNRWLPQLTFRIQVLKQVLGFSGYVVGFNSINYWARNADKLLIGRFLDATQLGLYGLAYKLMMMPLQLVTGVINTALHPVFASIQKDKQRMGRAYLKVLELIALIVFPVGVIFYSCAGPIIRILWGDGWLEAIPVFQVLSLLTIIQPLVSTSGSILLSNNQAGLLFKLGCLNSVIMIAGIAFGLPYGIVGVATGYAVSYAVLVLPITMRVVAKTLNLGVCALIGAIKRPSAIALVLLGGIYLLRQLTERHGNIVTLIGAIVLSGAVFLLGVFVGYRKDKDVLFSLLRHREASK